MSDLDKILGCLDDINPEAAFLSDNTLSNVDTWYDTGCYALNAIVSGKIREGGVPKGRIIVFTGESQTGKTLLINKILGLAQKQGMYPVIFDSEMSVDAESGKTVGLDPEKTKYCPVYTVDEAKNQISKFLDNVIEKKAQGKFIISIDSLGNLAGAKEVADIEKDKSVADMGLRAKSLKSMLRILTYKAAKAGVTILCSNHTYADPASMYPSLVKNQSGGSGPLYMSSIIVQLARRNEKQDDKNEEDKMLPEAKQYSGVTLRAMTTKNRFLPPFLEVPIYLNYRTGLDKYSGLLEMAVNHGIIIQNGPTYTKADGTKLGYGKSFKNDISFWEEYVIPNLQEKLNVAYKYADADTDAAKE